MAALEAERIIKVVVKEGAQHVKWVKIELLNRVRHRNVAFLIKVLESEEDTTRLVVDDIALNVDQVAILVDSLTLAV